MALTPEQIQAIAKRRGDTITPSTPAKNPAEEFAKRVGYTPEPEKPSLLKQFGTDVGSALIGGAKGIARAPLEFLQGAEAIGKFVGGALDKAIGIPEEQNIRSLPNIIPETPEILQPKGEIETAAGITAQVLTPSIKGIGKTLPSVAEGLETQTGKLVVKGKEALDTFKASRDIKLAQKTAKQVDELVGKITQGTRQEIAKAKEALKVVDTTDVKTYADLAQRADDTIAAFAKKQDEVLDTFGKVHSYAETKPVVKDAIKQLGELYEKTNNPTAYKKLTDLNMKFMKEGLSTREINQLAREYSSEMPKAFTKTGEAMTSVNKLASENTRKQLKAVAREVLPNDASKALDENITNLYTLKDTATRLDVAVQKLENRIKKRGLLEKIGRSVGRGIDVATGGSLKGLLSSMFPSNVGLKTLNSVDLQNMLTKNLAKLDKLSKSGTDEEILNYVDALIKSNYPEINPQISPK